VAAGELAVAARRLAASVTVAASVDRGALAVTVAGAPASSDVGGTPWIFAVAGRSG
jgi:hypothetical protein